MRTLAMRRINPLLTALSGGDTLRRHQGVADPSTSLPEGPPDQAPSFNDRFILLCFGNSECAKDCSSTDSSCFLHTTVCSSTSCEACKFLKAGDCAAYETLKDAGFPLGEVVCQLLGNAIADGPGLAQGVICETLTTFAATFNDKVTPILAEMDTVGLPKMVIVSHVLNNCMQGPSCASTFVDRLGAAKNLLTCKPIRWAVSNLEANVLPNYLARLFGSSLIGENWANTFADRLTAIQNILGTGGFEPTYHELRAPKDWIQAIRISTPSQYALSNRGVAPMLEKHVDSFRETIAKILVHLLADATSLLPTTWLKSNLEALVAEQLSTVQKMLDFKDGTLKGRPNIDGQFPFLEFFSIEQRTLFDNPWQGLQTPPTVVKGPDNFWTVVNGPQSAGAFRNLKFPRLTLTRHAVRSMEMWHWVRV